MVDADVYVIDFEPKEDDLIDDDTMMNDGNVDFFPTPSPKLKSTIMGGSSRLDNGGPNKTK
jgi:hypothetical protein